MGLGPWTTVGENSVETLKKEGPPEDGEGDTKGGEGKRARKDSLRWWSSRADSERKTGEASQREEGGQCEQTAIVRRMWGSIGTSSCLGVLYAAALFNARPLAPPVHSASSTEGASTSAAAVQFRKRKAKDA